MREGIHPNYYQAKVVCNCGNEFVTGSTKEDIHVEICSKCHSFYRKWQQPADVLISSIVNMVLSRKVRNQVEVIEISTFFLCNEKLNVTRKIS